MVLLIAVIWAFSKIALIVIALGYLVSGVLARLAYSWGRERRMKAGEQHG